MPRARGKWGGGEGGGDGLESFFLGSVRFGDGKEIRVM